MTQINSEWNNIKKELNKTMIGTLKAITKSVGKTNYIVLSGFTNTVSLIGMEKLKTNVCNEIYCTYNKDEKENNFSFTFVLRPSILESGSGIFKRVTTSNKLSRFTVSDDDESDDEEEEKFKTKKNKNKKLNILPLTKVLEFKMFDSGKDVHINDKDIVNSYRIASTLMNKFNIYTTKSTIGFENVNDLDYVIAIFESSNFTFEISDFIKLIKIYHVFEYDITPDLKAMKLKVKTINKKRKRENE